MQLKLKSLPLSSLPQIRAYTKAPHFVGSWLNSPFSGDVMRTGSDGTLRSALDPTEWRRVLRKIQNITIEDGGVPVCQRDAAVSFDVYHSLNLLLDHCTEKVAA